jgi:hypothetical protein
MIWVIRLQSKHSASILTGSYFERTYIPVKVCMPVFEIKSVFAKRTEHGASKSCYLRQDSVEISLPSAWPNEEPQCLKHF